MIIEYTCPITKIVRGKVEVPDDIKEEERLNVYKAAISKQLEPLHKQGFFVLDGDIQFKDAEYV